MKKTAAIFFFLGSLSIFLIIPLKQINKIKIDSSTVKISMQLNNPNNWIKWHPVLKKNMQQGFKNSSITRDFKANTFKILTPLSSYSVHSKSSTQFKISLFENKKYRYFDLYIIPSSNVNITELVTVCNIPMYKKIFSFINKSLEFDFSIQYLKEFMESDHLYYGFPLNIRKVVDSNVVVINEHVPIKEKFTVLDVLFKKLGNYIISNNLNITSPPIIQYTELLGDSVRVLGMFAINKQAKNKNKIRCMKMPVRGRMLVGYFKGKFKDRIHLKLAIQQYLLDKNIVSIVANYEKILSGKLPENEDSFVELEIYVPIL